MIPPRVFVVLSFYGGRVTKHRVDCLRSHSREEFVLEEEKLGEETDGQTPY